MKTNKVPEYYKLSGQRLEKDHHPHSPKTTFELSTVAIIFGVFLWISGLFWITTMAMRTQ